MPLATDPTPDVTAAQLEDLQAVVATQSQTIATQQAELDDTRAKLDLASGKMETDLADLNSQVAACQANLADLTCKRDCLAKKLDATRLAPIQARSQF